jgi:hypothetical protein
MVQNLQNNLGGYRLSWSLIVITFRHYLSWSLIVTTYRDPLPSLLIMITYRHYLSWSLTVITYRDHLSSLLIVITYRHNLSWFLHVGPANGPQWRLWPLGKKFGRHCLTRCYAHGCWRTQGVGAHCQNEVREQDESRKSGATAPYYHLTRWVKNPQKYGPQCTWCRFRKESQTLCSLVIRRKNYLNKIISTLQFNFLSVQGKYCETDTALYPSVLQLRVSPLHNKILCADPSSRTVLRRGFCRCSLVDIAGSNPAGGMDVCLLWVLCAVR